VPFLSAIGWHRPGCGVPLNLHDAFALFMTGDAVLMIVGDCLVEKTVD
jgi:hypothetical protein